MRNWELFPVQLYQHKVVSKIDLTVDRHVNRS